MLAMINVYFMSVYFEILVLFVLASEKIRKNTTMNAIEMLVFFTTKLWTQ